MESLKTIEWLKQQIEKYEKLKKLKTDDMFFYNLFYGKVQAYKDCLKEAEKNATSK